MFKNKKEPWLKPFPEKLANRVAKIATPDLITWVDQAMSETNRCISAYQRNGETVFVEDMLIGAEAINALVSELHRRTVV
jgi:hypothetical protein